MRFVSELSIAAKLRISFALLLLITALTGGAGLWGMLRIETTMTVINDMILNQVAFSGEAYNNLVLHNRRLYRHVLAESHEDMQQTEAQLQLNETLIRDLFQKHARSHPDSPVTEKRLLDRIDKVYPEYLALSDRVVRLSGSGKKREAMRLLESQTRPLYTELDRHFSDLIRFNIEEAKSAHRDSITLYEGVRVGVFVLLAVALLAGGLLAAVITRGILTPLGKALEVLGDLSARGGERAELAEAVAAGDFDRRLEITGDETAEPPQSAPRDEAGIILLAARSLERMQRNVDRSFNRMAESLRQNRLREEKRSRLERCSLELSRILRGDRPLEETMDAALRFVCESTGGCVGRFLRYDGVRQILVPMSRYAIRDEERSADPVPVGSGVAGEAARSRKRIVVGEVPEGYLTISSTLGKAPPRWILALPLIHDEILIGVIEIGSFTPFSDESTELLDTLSETLSVGIGIIIARKTIDDLLEQAQSQAEELRVQQEELQQSNEELEERAELLERQREQIRIKNRDLERIAEELRAQAAELERVSLYKSQFLANMSHELRTPLNSILILSSLLMEDREGRLTDKQKEFAATIRSAGNDLLALIDEILDLSRIEAGKLSFTVEPVTIPTLVREIGSLFNPVAEQKGLSFAVDVQEGVPPELMTDGKRLMQIIRNLLSNAFKFTPNGSVNMTISPIPSSGTPSAVSFSIRDTGIGIPAEKQELIFQAFQQADGSTSRRFGGTGLGLAISRELARALGGNITLESREGEGSTFTLTLPLDPPIARNEKPATETTPLPSPTPPVTGTSPGEEPSPRERSILIVEDDPLFSQALSDLIRRKGFVPIVANEGESGIEIARERHPDAIILDVVLPGIDGWEVMRRLKDDPSTRFIPVHFIIGVDERPKGLALGASGYLTKPVSADDLERLMDSITGERGDRPRSVLIVEDDETAARGISELLDGMHLSTAIARTGTEAFSQIRSGKYDAVILDLGLPDMPPDEIIETLHTLPPSVRPPLIVHSGRDLTHSEEMALRRYTDSIIIKGSRSPERLMNEVSLFLSLVRDESGAEKRPDPHPLGDDSFLAGKKILLVDDDMRNLFSLSSFLSDKEMIVHEAENGRVALNLLDQNPDIDLVLLDVMMPEMDGLTTVRKIRSDPRFGTLPVIMLTAKAMKSDRDECFEAGASDYLQKPVDLDRLLTLLRVWLYGKS